MTTTQKTVRDINSGIIYLTSPLPNQTMGIPLTMLPDAQPGDTINITLDENKPVSAEHIGHVHLCSND
ncbi:hypothetical protein HYV31_03075 [candidate division WWE3 bacterium]|nr:hypothetical protein [candidate division WWE3 bacterium]